MRVAARRIAAVPRVSARPAVDTFQRDVAPLVKKYCAACHQGKNAPAGIAVAQYRDTASVLKGREVWERIARNVAGSAMPPPGAPQPTPAERDRIVHWVEATFSSADCKLDDPGRVTMRRLNREEYNNTVRDLLGVNFRPADSFPSDDVGYGFDNIGDVLSISPLLMEKYLAAAEKIARTAIATPETGGKLARFEGADLAQAGGDPFGTSRLLNAAGEIGVEYVFPEEGEYLLRAKGYSRPVGREPARMALRLDGKEVQAADVTATDAAPDVFEARVKVAAGKHRFAVALLNPYAEPLPPTVTNRRGRSRSLVVESLAVQGPVGLPRLLPVSHRRIITCRPTPETRDACARKILGDFARRAYRRPVTKAEVDRLVRCVDLTQKEGESFERGIQLAVQAVLVSPNFLFRVEIDPKPNDPKATRLINSYEMASRLSYFLWSSMPDEELFALAAKDRLQDPKVIAAQVQRMVRDPRARALAQNFAGQWLQLRRLSEASPDPERFPGFDDKLREAMRTETEKFFEAVVKEDRSVLDFLDGRFTYLNETLARHYGIEGVKGDNFRRVPLTGDQRMGVLTHASVLTVTSNPTRTSPVKRGKWVMEQLLDSPIPPPPPGVPELPDDQNEPLKRTLRQRKEQHRTNPNCASCHARMDPIGFGLENYDATGRWRTRDGEFPIDSSGVLPGGKRFQGPAQLIAILKAQQDGVVRCLTEKLLTYALGRGLESYDNCNVAEIAQRVASNDYRFSAMVTEIVLSEPFRKRRGDGGQSR